MPTATKTKEDVLCADCGAKITDQETLEESGKVYCEDCITTCDECDTKIPTEKQENIEYHGDVIDLCSDCRDNFTQCGNCGEYCNRFLDEWGLGRNGECYDCTDAYSEENEFPYRDWKESKKFISRKTPGSIVKSQRKFGLEVEATLPREGTPAVHHVKDEIPEEIGIGSDSGSEWQTPPVSGFRGERLVKKLCHSLNKHGFTGQRGNGLHVHIDATDICQNPKKFELVKSLWLFYIVFDPVLIKLVPAYRLLTSWCKPCEQTFDTVLLAEDMETLETIWYGDKGRNKDSRKGEPKDSSRYHGINMHMLFHGEHLEIRYHEGTVDAKTMLEWANLHLLIMDKVREGIDIEWLKAMQTDKEASKKMAEYIGLSPESREYFNQRSKLLAKQN